MRPFIIPKKQTKKTIYISSLFYLYMLFCLKSWFSLCAKIWYFSKLTAKMKWGTADYLKKMWLKIVTVRSFVKICRPLFSWIISIAFLFLSILNCMSWLGLNSFWTDAGHALSRSKHCILVLSGWRTANCSVRLKSACSDSSWINNPHTASHANPCKWGLGAIQFLSVFVCRVHMCSYVETRGKNWVC